jgi:hypothetical protein
VNPGYSITVGITTKLLLEWGLGMELKKFQEFENKLKKN